MIGLALKLLTFLYENCQLPTSVIILTGIFFLLAKSIKKRPGIYYFVFAIPAIIFIARQILSSCGINFLEFPRESIMSAVLREYVHVAGFAYPLLVIIMFVGALPPENRYVKRILMIRKELSIISGFPILIHSWVRIRHTFPDSISFFTDKNSYLEKNEWVNSEIGAGFFNTGYILGIILFVLFIILWITSFDSLHRRLGAVRWKKIQRWSYALYALLFIHSILLNLGWMLNSSDRDRTLGGIIAISFTCLVFGSYLVLRIRKARRDALYKKLHNHRITLTNDYET
jgi:DMSO/TMAO reductase YedYZ heme-binding membrane subunit